jgi:hypothetical protein
MTTFCATCSSALYEGSQVCPNCGTAVAVSDGVVEVAPTTTPVFKSFEDQNDLNGIGGWLILPAIGLVVSPFMSLHGIFVVDLPILTGGKYEEFLTGHPAVTALIVFELTTNAIFFTKRRILPRCMIAYFAINFFLLLADHLATRALLPSTDSTSGTMAVVRAFVGAAVWIPYFLVSRRVKTTFIN